MLPITDNNPATRRPILTVAIIVICVGVYFGFQQTSGTEQIEVSGQPIQIDADLRFNLERAAIPCELATGEPLSLGEVDATFGSLADDTACRRNDLTPPVFPGKNVWLAVVTSMFLHGGLLHLGGNMLSLWIFGNNIEDRLGHVFYALLYLAGGLVATAAHVLVQPASTIPVIGASGAIAAVMGSYLVWYPNARVRTVVFVGLIFIRDIAAKWFLGIWFILQFFTGAASGVAWMAHVGGFAFGALVALAVRGGRGLWGRHPEPEPRPLDPWAGGGGSPWS